MEANHIPAYAINQLEMWQPETFDPVAIEKDLAMAEFIGMTTRRVFLHNLLWQNDSARFISRIEIFLQIAARHNVKPLFVIFDSWWDPNPQSGLQRQLTPGIHNLGWVQSPGLSALLNPTEHARLESYVKGLLSHFANDSRILAWDLWNEPDQSNHGLYNWKYFANYIADSKK